MKSLQGKWALVTGASSGIGRDFATALAEKRSNLVLTARRSEPMQRLAEELQEKHGIQVKVESVDLSLQGASATLKSQLDTAGIAIDILINNAGMGVIGEFVDQPLDKITRMLHLNVISLTELTHAFGRPMKERRSGHILLVGSIAAYQPCPLYAAYAATKSYVFQLGETLHTELAPHNVGVTVLSPGVTETEFFVAAGHEITGTQKQMMMTSRQVVDIGLSALLHKRSSVVPGLLNKILAFSARLMPRQLSSRIAYKMMKDEK